jgi:DNA processing protein
MDAFAVRAVLARTPALRASHVRALAAAAGGDLTRSVELDTLNSVDLPPQSRAHLVFPDLDVLRSDLEWIETSGAQLLAASDNDYPPQLLAIRDPPPVLFVLGEVWTLASPQLAMVGSRTASCDGCERAHRFAEYFAKAGLTVTSGLALGIDAASHAGALSGGGQTVAVYGTSLDRVYPTRHAALAERIRSSGALVSEFPPGTAPRKGNFPQRNRLISGLSRGTLVVEATRWSGSLVTARFAQEQGRKVFAIPGPLTSVGSGGCHQLLQAGATLVLSPLEVLSHLNFPLLNKGLVCRTEDPARPTAMDKGYEMLLDAVGFEPVTLDVLVIRTGLPGESIASSLLVLELEGHIASYPGGRYGRVST